MSNQEKNFCYVVLNADDSVTTYVKNSFSKDNEITYAFSNGYFFNTIEKKELDAILKTCKSYKAFSLQEQQNGLIDEYINALYKSLGKYELVL